MFPSHGTTWMPVSLRMSGWHCKSMVTKCLIIKVKRLKLIWSNVANKLFVEKKNESIYTKVLLINVIFFYKYSLSNYYAPNISVRSRELLMGLKQRAPLIYYKNQFILICFCRTHEMRTWGNMWCVASLLSSFREQTPGTVSIPKSYFIASGPGKQEQLNLQ